jgi:hypothetical protein
MPPPIPDRELIVRARLEDMIDQVLLHRFSAILNSLNNYYCPQVLYERLIYMKSTLLLLLLLLLLVVVVVVVVIVVSYTVMYLNIFQ